MNKQKFPLSLGLVLIFSSLLVSPIRTNAGQAVIKGTAPDSSSITGGTFGPGGFGTGGNIGAGGVTRGNGGFVIAPPAVQNNVNAAAANLFPLGNGGQGSNPGGQGSNPGGQGSNPGGQQNNPIIGAALGDQRAGAEIGDSLRADGAPDESVKELQNNFTGMFEGGSAAIPGTPVAQLTQGQLVASTKVFAATSSPSEKSLKQADSIIAQNGSGVQVNLTKLNGAIVAYNGIVTESSPVALQKLSQNAYFVKVGKVLKDLRSAVK